MGLRNAAAYNRSRSYYRRKRAEYRRFCVALDAPKYDKSERVSHVIPSDRLTYANRTFTVEASSVREYALTTTVEIESTRTGTRKEFYFVEPTLDANGDVAKWTWKSNDGLVLVVFND